MSRELTERRLFRQSKPHSNPFRVLFWMGVILGGIALLLQIRRGEIKPLFMPTPTPTRTSNSYVLEAQAYFAAGKLDDPNTDQDAIGTYKLATQVDPQNAQVWAELARIQTYSSELLSTDAERMARLQEARDSVDQAVKLAPDDSTVHAVRSFVLDWNASSNLVTLEQRQAYLNEAERDAVRALQLDPNNALALAFYAEVLVDQQKWSQAEQYAEQAVARAPSSMDIHRAYATVLESVGQYRRSIEEYQKAADIAPNFTYLYLRIGLGYRNLGLRTPIQVEAEKLYTTALEYFDRAAGINEQLGVRNPQPYIAIAKTYTQMGQALVASRNAEKALNFDPANANTYGQLGIIYVQSKNYESALTMLQCAVEGCTTWWLVPVWDAKSLDAIHCMSLDGCSDDEKATARYIFRVDAVATAEAIANQDQEAIAQPLPDPIYEERSVSVEPLALTNPEVAYYYIGYGSMLAFLGRPGDGRCEKSLALMAQLRAKFPDDIDLIANAKTNETLCYRLMGTPVP
jgi:tetratricopeptide (TPR) repeat protein